jgi:hypothetical protein
LLRTPDEFSGDEGESPSNVNNLHEGGGNHQGYRRLRLTSVVSLARRATTMLQQRQDRLRRFITMIVSNALP